MTRRNIKLILAYEGTQYLGWQKTISGRRIEEELEKAVTQILQHPVNLQAAGRTDAGVHERRASRELLHRKGHAFR